MAEEWWTKKQACRHLDIDPKTFERYVADGMPVTKLRGRVFVQRQVVQAEYRKRRLGQKATRATP
jgi:predicted site-specific integrase-resolvase